MEDKYMGAMPDSYYRMLEPDEEKTFRGWARENYEAGGHVKSEWHPSVRDECKLIDKEIISGNGVPEQTKYQ